MARSLGLAGAGVCKIRPMHRNTSSHVRVFVPPEVVEMVLLVRENGMRLLTASHQSVVHMLTTFLLFSHLIA